MPCGAAASLLGGPHGCLLGSPGPQHLPHRDQSGKARGVTDTPLPAGTWRVLAPPGWAHLGGSIGAGDRGVERQRTGARRGAAPLGRWSSAWRASVFRELSPTNFGRSSRWLRGPPAARAPSWPSGHLVQAPEAGAHLSQPTSGEGGPQAPPPPPTPKPSPGAPTLVYLGGSIPGSARGVE